MSLDLICEGRCNPMIGAVDDEIRVIGRENVIMHGERFTRATPRLLVLQRTLVHTPHTMVESMLAKCQVCDAVRQYGRTW